MKVLILLAVSALAVEASVTPVFDKVAATKKVVDEVLKEETRAISTGRTLSEWTRDFMGYFGFGDYSEYEYYDYIDNDIGFSEPGSSYVSYQPSRDDNYVDYSTGETSWADSMMTAVFAGIPLFVMMSLIPAGIFTIPLRRRSHDDSWLTNDITFDTSSIPLIRAIETNDILDILPELTTRGCQEKLFCEISKIGQDESSSYMQQAVYYASTLTPPFISRRMGLGRLFELSKTGRCDLIHCSATPTEIESQSLKQVHYPEEIGS